MKITAFGVRFSDNDYYNILNPLVESIVRMISFYSGEREVFTKEYFVELIRSSLPTFYRIHESDNLEIDDLTNDYLTTHPIEVYLNEEVNDFLTTHDFWDNSEFYYSYDLEWKGTTTVQCV